MSELKVGDWIKINAVGVLTHYIGHATQIVDVKPGDNPLYLISVSDDGSEFPLYRNELIPITKEEAMLWKLSN